MTQIGLRVGYQLYEFIRRTARELGISMNAYIVMEMNKIRLEKEGK